MTIGAPLTVSVEEQVGELGHAAGYQPVMYKHIRHAALSSGWAAAQMY